MSTATLAPSPFAITEDSCAAPYYIEYGKRSNEARALRHGNDWQNFWKIPVTPAGTDTFKIGAMFIDVQGTFCYPLGGDVSPISGKREGELYVGGASGRGAIEDNCRIGNWILHNLPYITKVNCTMDTHTTFQVFHEAFFVCGQGFVANEGTPIEHEYKEGDHPLPMTFISTQEVKNGRWKVNPEVAWAVTGKGNTYMAIQKQVEHYVQELEKQGKYTLCIWPYHAMLGSANHALVTAIEEAAFFHGQARGSQSNFEIKGGNPLTENYSVLRPEVLTRPDGGALASKNSGFIEALLQYDALFIGGQAKSHCVAWTIDDLLAEIKSRDPELAKKVWLLEDTTSPVVVPGIIDFTDDANAAFDKFKSEGMNVTTTDVELSDILPVRKAA